MESQKWQSYMDMYKTPRRDLAPKTKEDVFRKFVERSPKFGEVMAKHYGDPGQRAHYGWDARTGQIVQGPQSEGAAQQAAARMKELSPEMLKKHGQAIEAMRAAGWMEEAGPAAEKWARRLHGAEDFADWARQKVAKGSPKTLAAGERGRYGAAVGGGGLVAGQTAAEPGVAEAQSPVAPQTDTGYDAISRLVGTAPQALGAWEDVLMTAAAEGDDALISRHTQLSDDSPAYREYLRGLVEDQEDDENKGVRRGERGRRAYSGTYNNP